MYNRDEVRGRREVFIWVCVCLIGGDEGSGVLSFWIYIFMRVVFVILWRMEKGYFLDISMFVIKD